MFYISVICLTLLCISLATGWGRTLQDETEDGGEGGFLSKDLPLKVVVTTPSELATANGTLDVQDQQALIVSISLTVIRKIVQYVIVSLMAFTTKETIIYRFLTLCIIVVHGNNGLQVSLQTYA